MVISANSITAFGFSDRQLMDAVGAVQSQLVVYVFRNPATLAKDWPYLMGKGYLVEWIQPVDMFPQTSHVESIVLMTNSGLKGK